MSISAYSITMAILWFSLAALIGSGTLRRITNGGLLYVAVIFILAIIRGVMPYEFSQSIILRSKTWYPFLQNLMQTPLFSSLTVGSCLLYIWLAGAVVRLLWTFRKLLLMNKYRTAAAAAPVSGEYTELAQAVAEELGYSGPVRVYISPTSSTAFQAGFLRPFVILPANSAVYSTADIRSMLFHEITHFLGNDLWIKCAVNTMACVLWWNPAAAILNSSIDQMLELRCDSRVCMKLSPADQVAYMQTLLNMAKLNTKTRHTVTAGYTGTNEEARIIQRFERIRNANAAVRNDVRTVLSLLLCIVLFLGSYCIILQPWVKIPQTEDLSIASFEAQEDYIVHRPNDTYELYVNNEYMFALHEEELTQEPFSTYKIYEGGHPDETTASLGN